jgi:hypothetical protein
MKQIYLLLLLVFLISSCVNSGQNTNDNLNVVNITTTGVNTNADSIATTSYIEAQFLPVLHLHPDDPYRPSTVSWVLPRAELRYEGNSNPILKKGEITETNLQQQTSGGESSGGGDKVTKFYLDYPDDSERDITRRGNLEEFSCYVHVTRRNDPMEIQYWFYYPYNGSIAPVLDIAHEGDWEHITVRLKPDRSAIDKIYYSAHDEQHSWWVDAAGHVTPEGRPIVYSAKHTHGSYPSPGKWNTAAPTVQDETKDGGPAIDYNAQYAWRSLDVPAPLFDWVNFNGHWGKPGAFQASSGFPGPKFQKEWKEDPR